MSTSLVLGSVGAAVGFAFGGPVGARWGFLAGSTLGSFIDAPDGPSPGDLTAPQIQEGALLPRPYGTVLLTVNFTSVSDYTATANDTGGKGGPPEGSAGYTYTLDVLGTIAHRVPSMPLVAITRVWVNKKLVETRLAASDSASLAASAATEAYTSLTLYPGGSAQTPPPEYETRVGTANASAYRNVATVEIIGLVCGGSKTPPLVEVECITSGTQGGALTLLQSRFIGASATDESYYARGAPTQNGGTVIAGAFVINNNNDTNPNTPSSLYYAPANLRSNGTDALTVECIAAWTETHNTSPIMRFIPRIGFPDAYWSINYRDGGGAEVDTTGGLGKEYIGAVPSTCHFAIVFSSTGTRVYFNGQKVYEVTGSAIPSTDEMAIYLGDMFGLGVGNGTSSYSIHGFRIRQEEVYTGASFSPPTEIQPPDGAPWVPGTANLKSIVDAELAMNQAIVTTDHDTTDLAGVTVRGFKAVGPPGKTIAELGDIFYFDLVPGNPLRYQRRGAAVVGTIANVDTGVGVDEAGAPFTGLKIGNDIERPSVVGLSAPNASADHEPVFRLGDRITTEGPDVEKRRTEVGLTPAEVQGRALAMSLMARASAHTAEYGLSDKYAAAEPGDAYYVYDDQGNLYNKIIRSLTYADGVKQCKWELNDTSALVEIGITDADYTPSLVVNAPADTDLLLLDIPILRDVDDDAGFYAVASSDSTDWRGASLYESANGTDYTLVGTFTTKAITGTTTTALGDWPTPWHIDNKSSVTVSVNGTLSSYSFDDTVAGLATPYLIGDELVYAMTATLVSAGVYTLTNFIRALKGTESFTGTHAVGDRFVVISTSGIIRVEKQASELNVEYSYKAVTTGRTLAGATAQTFTNTGVGLKPYAPVDVQATSTSNGSITLTWNRRTRLSSTFLSTTEIPLGESTEAYAVQIMASSAFATVTRTIDATSATCSYTLAQQESDFGSAQSTLYVRVRQVNATVGNGYATDSTVVVGSSIYFVPLTSNSYPDARLSYGSYALVTRNASNLMGLYRYADGAATLELIATTSADNTYRYLQTFHLEAVDSATGDWVMYLRGYTNPSSLRKLMYGNLAAGSALTTSPAFMTASPPFAIGFNAGNFIALCVDGNTYSSSNSGATWSSLGAFSGVTAPAADNFDCTRMRVIGSRLALCYGGDLFFCTLGDGLAWSAATGDVSTAPATYTTNFAVTSIDTLGSVGCALAVGEISGVFTALIYTSTDGQAWTQRATGNALGSAPFANMIGQGARIGVCAFNNAFYVFGPTATPDIGFTQRGTLGTFDGKVVYYAYQASNSRATSTRLLRFDSQVGDPIVASSDGESFTETIAWPT